MKLRLLLPVLFLWSSWQLSYGEEELGKKYPLLAALEIPTKEIPEGCAIRKVSAEEEEGLKGFRNCAILTDPRFFVLGDERIATLVDTKAIEAAYVGLYKHTDGRSDIGIIGWARNSESAAKNLHLKLLESYKNQPERVRFWQVEKCVAWLFRDPGISNPLFAKFETIVGARLARVTHVPAKVSEKSVQGDELENAARDAAKQFISAMTEKNIEGLMDAVDTPFVWGNSQRIEDRDTIKKTFEEAFARKSLNGLAYEVVACHMFSNQNDDVLDE
jgi:hypothetical protein